MIDRMIGLYLVRAVGLAVVALPLFPRLRRRMQRRAEARAQSEPACYKRLKRAFSGRDPSVAYRALEQWTRSIGFPSIAEWAARSGNTQLQARLADFELALFGTAAPLSAPRAMAALAPLVYFARSRVLRQTKADRHAALPPCNP